jgi:hypothetical protein
LSLDESKAKHDVNEVEEKAAHGEAQSGDNRCPKDISELAWILERTISLKKKNDQTGLVATSVEVLKRATRYLVNSSQPRGSY